MTVNVTQLDVGGLSISVPARASAEVAFLYHEIFEQRCYLQHGITVRDGDVVIDAGANLGLFSLFVARSVPGARIYAFEPLPPILQCAERNLRAYTQVKLENLGLAEREREVTFAYFPKLPSNSTMYPGDKRSETASIWRGFKLRDIWRVSKLHFVLLSLVFPLRRRIVRSYFADKFRDPQLYRCQTTTLDRVFEREQLAEIALLKVDVEGAELDVLAGLSDDNLRRVRQIALELSPKHKSALDRLEQRLRGAGFDRLVLESAVAGSDPRTDIYPCVVYALRRSSKEPA
jgi:FkbM family methyltransferase